MVKSPLAWWADLSAGHCSAAPWHVLLLRHRRIIMRLRRYTSKNRSVASFSSATGTGTDVYSDEFRFAIDHEFLGDCGLSELESGRPRSGLYERAADAVGIDAHLSK